jgi:transposase
VQVVHERCCGLDVHKRTVVACLLTSEQRETRTFGTMTRDLLALADWLTAEGCTHVAMESTGVYWKPVYNLLEDTGLHVIVVNAYHIKAVPGRKTDVKDAEWIADLLRHGLVRGSFIPDRSQRELRELVRYRKTLIQSRASEVNRVQKILEGANIKLGSVASNVMGASGRAMLESMVEGTTDPKVMAALAKGRLRRKRDDLEEALNGLLGPHQRMILATQLRHVDFLDEEIERLSAEIEQRMRPFEEALQRVDTIPGVARRAAEQILAETGIDMSRFPTAAHFASWAKVCPGNNESAGKRSNCRSGKGNRWLRQVLLETAHAAARTKNTYLAAQYHRIAARRGKSRAALAVAHTILIIVYHILKNGTTYQELGPDFYDTLDRQAVARRAIKRLEQLGYKVTVEEVA